MQNQELKIDEAGFLLTSYPLELKLKSLVDNEDYSSIDNLFQKETEKNSKLFKFLSQFAEFTSIEFIISLREAKNEWEEDGIWHDDGSRVLAFSISLMDSEDTEGGILEIRKKGEDLSAKIKPFNFGEIVIFKTGTSGFEHKINAVTKGKRLIVAGWCS